MQVEQRLAQVLMKKLRRYVSTASIYDEVIWFLKSEVDERLVPADTISHLADPIIADSASYTDELGNFYLLITIETGDPEPYEVWLVNDVVVPHFVRDFERQNSRYYLGLNR